MNPTDAHYKTKRNLLLFVGLLLLAVFAGFKIVNNEHKISVLPFQLENPEYLGIILFVLVLFFLFQFSIQWAAQNSEVQVNRFHRIDFVSTTTISAIVVLLYVGFASWEFLTTTFTFAKFSAEKLTDGFLSTIIAAVVTVLGFLFSMLVARRFSSLLQQYGRYLKSKSANEDAMLEDILTSKSQGWSLIFNPKIFEDAGGVRGSKRISFKVGGEIGEGQNKNEAQWRVRNGLLEIINHEGKVFSRFVYEKDKDEFVHTNDADTLSIRSQKIVPNLKSKKTNRKNSG